MRGEAPPIASGNYHDDVLSDYLKEIEYATRHLIPVIWEERSACGNWQLWWPA